MDNVKCGDCEYHTKQTKSGCLKFSSIKEFKEYSENMDDVEFPIKEDQILLWCDGFEHKLDWDKIRKLPTTKARVEEMKRQNIEKIEDYGFCPVCNNPFHRGETLRFKDINGKRIFYHPYCFKND